MNRPRSNALSGPRDPRYLNPAQQLGMAMRAPITVADELEQFLIKIFARKDLMETEAIPHNISIGVYKAYANIVDGVVPAPEMDVLRTARGVWELIRHKVSPTHLSRALFQKAGCPFLDEKVFGDDDYALTLLGDFLYFQLHPGAATCRVYLNVIFESMPNVVQTVLDLPPVLYAEITGFKTDGPGASRADSVVIYCKTRATAEQVAAIMLARIAEGTVRSSDQTVPAMTTRLGAGVALGAEPRQQETALMAPVPGRPRTAQSFGTIRSQAIAAAILSYRANRHLLGGDYEVFRKFAAIAFKGFGLDPDAPGN
ncbi:hypothetical protein FHY18_003614 [Xanthomonas arboricola]|uniref:T3SS effector HopA1 family protein n=1 Tax=Xanthomonas sp. 3793 TaxID=3035312 RepID=UPI00216787DF|nr:T3SS effector HopA1 family protein [Xanthomonas sp. 3793]MCS3747986.1 hypothetical protein [Xanthomonas sp. 3793]